MSIIVNDSYILPKYNLETDKSFNPCRLFCFSNTEYVNIKKDVK